MITPTGATVAQYWQAIKNRNPAYVRITFANGVILDNTDIEQTGISITDIINGDTDLMFGKAVMKSLSMKVFLSSKTDNMSWEDEFTLEFGIDISGTTNWITIGTFSGERPDKYPVNGVVEFTASDRMKMFDVSADAFLAGLVYPITFENLYHAMCNYVGIQYEAGDELPIIMNRSFSASPVAVQGLTCRDILAAMAEACGCYARITPSGKVKMVWFTNQTYYVNADEEFGIYASNSTVGKTWQDLEVYTWEDLETYTWGSFARSGGIDPVDSLIVKSSNDDIGVTYPGAGSNTYYIIDNPFLYYETSTDIDNYVKPIYDRLAAFAWYLPMSVECTGNWLVESGDVITVDFDGDVVILPVFARTLVWRGTCKDTYEATGNIYQERISVSNHEKLTNMGRIHEVKQTIEGNYERIQDQFGNYYTKIETATYIALQLTDYYGKVSGITIDANGVDITGSKYVRITAATNTYWEYNQYGLEYRKSGVSRPLIRFGAGFSGAGSTPDLNCGVFEYTDGDNTTGKMALVAANHTQNKYDYFLIKLATVGSALEISLLPSGNVKAYLGSADKTFRGIYTQDIYATNTVGELNIYTKPSGTKALTVWEVSNTNDVYLSTYKYVHAIDTSTAVVVYGRVQSVSSRNIKKNITKLKDCGDVIDKLEPVSFLYKKDSSGKKHLGLIYEDTVDILPEICDSEDRGDSLKTINYVELVPVLLKEIQSLRKRVAELETKGA